MMGFLETGMRVLDSASALLARLQELAVLGANNTNTDADHAAINLEAEAIADEFNRLMTTSTYKGKPVFATTAGSEYVSMGGRNQEMTFGLGTVDYSELYKGATADQRTISGGPNDGASVGLRLLPSDAVAAKKFGDDADNGFQKGYEYEVVSFAAGITDANGNGKADANDADVALIITHTSHGAATELGVGDKFTVTANITDNNLALLNALSGRITLKRVSGTDDLTKLIEGVQAKINTARVEAGSQYAALESAVYDRSNSSI